MGTGAQVVLAVLAGVVVLVLHLVLLLGRTGVKGRPEPGRLPSAGDILHIGFLLLFGLHLAFLIGLGILLLGFLPGLGTGQHKCLIVAPHQLAVDPQTVPTLILTVGVLLLLTTSLRSDHNRELIKIRQVVVRPVGSPVLAAEQVQLVVDTAHAGQVPGPDYGLVVALGDHPPHPRADAVAVEPVVYFAVEHVQSPVQQDHVLAG